MHRIVFAIVIALAIDVGCAPSDRLTKIDDHFYSDLSSENNRLAADLYLHGFNRNLDTLTYNFYVAYLSKNEAPSATGLSALLKKSDDHYFKARKDAFLMILYFKDEGKIVGDNSGTAFVDTLIQLTPDVPVPVLSEIAAKMKF